MISKNLLIFSYPTVETAVLGAQKNRLIETVLLSTHNIFFENSLIGSLCPHLLGFLELVATPPYQLWTWSDNYFQAHARVTVKIVNELVRQKNLGRKIVNIFLSMFWVLKRTVSSRGFFWVPTTYVLFGKYENHFMIMHSNLEARLVHDKHNEMACVSCDHFNQPEHQTSQFRVCPVHPVITWTNLSIQTVSSVCHVYPVHIHIYLSIKPVYLHR